MSNSIAPPSYIFGNSTEVYDSTANAVQSLNNVTINIVEIINKTVSIDLQNLPFNIYLITMIDDIELINFINPVINGNYTIYLTSDSNSHTLFKNFGALNNLNGDIRIAPNANFSLQLYYNGVNFLCQWCNYT